MRRWFVLALVLVWAAPGAFARKAKACVSADEAARHPNKDVCVSVHVYDVVELPDGTRFLDVCSPDTPDDRCHFTIVSLWEDRADVGSLLKYRDANIQMRGFVRPMHGRWGMELSHVRQLYGGPPKFRPNPRLAHGFNGEQQRPAIADPNLRPHGGRRAFMNSREQERR
ncbi:MAG: hypothetical protein ACLGSD_08395 [Acidobacteriota bacterium]